MSDKKEKLRMILEAFGNLPIPGVYQASEASGSC
jgi:hypothetical protein